MVGGVAQLVERHALRLALRAGLHTVDGLVDGAVVDQLGTGTGAQQRGLVEHVRQIGARETRRTHGDHMQVDVRHERLALGMDLQNRLAAFQIRGFDGNLTVETSWTQQRRVKHIWAVRRGDNNQVRIVVKAVHLDEQLIEGLLAFVVPAAHAGATLAADSVDFVDKDDGRGVLLRLVEQFAHTGGAKADEHLDEVRAGSRVERHARLACDGAREQRLTGSWRTVEQHTARNAGTQGLVLGRILEEVLDFLDLLQCSVLTLDIGEPGARGLAFKQLSAVLATTHAEHAVAHAAHHEPQEPQENNQRQDGRDEIGHRARLLHVGCPAVTRVVLLHGLDDIRALGEGVVELDVLAVIMRLALCVGLRIVVLELKLDQLPIVDHFGVGGLPVLKQFQTVLRVDGLCAAGGEELERADGQQHQHHDPQPRGLPPRVITVASLRRVIGIATAEWIAVVSAHRRPLLRALRIAHACSPWYTSGFSTAIESRLRKRSS